MAVTRADARLSALVVDRVASPDEHRARCIAPSLALEADGSHWLAAWMMVRDGQVYEPWFDGRIAAQRRTQGNFDARWLHDQTRALMISRGTYHRLPREAATFDMAAALDGRDTPLFVAPGPDFAAFVLSLDLSVETTQ